MAGTYTYDAALGSNKDWVRWLIGETDTDASVIADEEILAVLTEETATGQALKYYAAARCLAVLKNRWAKSGDGIVSKRVGDLSRQFGIDAQAGTSVDSLIAEYRKRGARLLSPGSSILGSL